jgi:hypothetical protein
MMVENAKNVEAGYGILLKITGGFSNAATSILKRVFVSVFMKQAKNLISIFSPK